MKTTGNFVETFKILWTTWIFGDYAILPRTIISPTIVDIGSHIGISALYFNYRHPGAKIICYEPNPNTYKILINNIKSHQNIKSSNCAVHDYSGSTPFNISGIAWGNTMLTKGVHNIEVDVISASDICQKHIDLLKIDAEGSEYHIMKNLDKSGTIDNVDRIVMEFHGQINNKKKLRRILDILRNNNYVYTIGRDIRIRKVQENSVFKDKTSKYDYLIISAQKNN